MQRLKGQCCDLQSYLVITFEVYYKLFSPRKFCFYVLEDKDIINFLNNISYTGTYQDFAPMLTGKYFDADKWAELFSKAGAQFVIFF